MGQRLHGTGGDGLQEPWRKPVRSSGNKALGQEKSCQIYTELLYLGRTEETMPQSPTGLSQGLDSPWGWEADPTCALGCSCHCASPSNPSWGQAFVMKPNSPDGCLLERSFGCLI